MTDGLQRTLADLTPEQRELLALRLRRKTENPSPVSFTQEQLWFLDRREPGSPAYNVPFALRLEGPLNVPRLHGALDAVVARHDALRTVFAEHDGGIAQHARQRLRLPMPVTDLRALPDDARRQAVGRASTAHSATSFSLTRGPLLATRLLAIADDRHVLLVTAHHIIFDAWSADVFTRDLVALYGELSGEGPARLPALTTQFVDHARRYREPAALAVMQQHLAYWRDRLDGLPPECTLPPDHPRPAVQSHRGRHREFVLSAVVTDGLARQGRGAGATLNAVLLAGFAALLRRFNGQDDVTLGMPSAGRPRTELEPLIGSFANVLVMRLDLSGDPTVEQLLTLTHRAVSAAFQHQQAPYARVVEQVGGRRDPSRNPLFQVMLTVAEAGEESLTAAGLTVAQVPVDSDLTDFDLFIALTRGADGLHGAVHYNTDLYLDETVEGLVSAAVDGFTELADAAHEPERPLASFGALRRDEVALAATFTADLVRAPLEAWLRLLRVPVGVTPVGYGQLIQHLFAPADRAAAVCLIRWQDWLRRCDPEEGPAAAATILDAAMTDLESGVRAYRRQTTAPLLLVVCPASGRFRDGEWATVLGRLDDGLALLGSRVPGTRVVWARDPDGSTADVSADPVADEQADRLGHVPYTARYSALLAAEIGRLLHGIPDGSGGLLGPGRLATPAGAERAVLVTETMANPAALLERLVPVRPPATADHAYVAPRTPTEERLAALWQRMLPVDRVSVTADFFSLGGHSLVATQVLSQVKAEFGRDVSLYALFTNPTVEQLARLLDDATESTTPLGPAPSGAEPVASSTQQRLWALAELNADTARHNTTFAARLTGPLDVTALRRSVAEIVARHESLRTTFTSRRGEAAPVVHPELDCWLAPIDLTDRSMAERDAAARVEIDRHVENRYDLATGPLLRVRLLVTGHDQHLLLIGMHHIICDNTSWSLFLDELVELYGAFVAGLPSPLPPLPLQFGDVAYDERQRQDAAATAADVAYWRRALHGAPTAIDLPIDHERPAVRSDRAGHQAATLPAGLGAAVRELARAEGVSPFTVLLAAFAVLLRHESGQSDLVVGVPWAGRDRPELERLIGCCTDLLPFRLDLTGWPSFRRLLRRVHTTGLEAYRHKGVPFAGIVEALRLPRDASRHPLFQSVFNLLDLVDETPRLSGLDVEPIEVGAPGVDFDLFLTLSWGDGELRADLTYRADLSAPRRARRLLDRFTATVSELLARPDEPIGPTRGRVPAPAPIRAHGHRVTVAASFPVEPVLATARFWAAQVRPGLELLPAGRCQVLRPLLDIDGPFADPDGLAVVLLRWEDWLTGADLSAPRALPAAATRLDGALRDLVEAVRRFRLRNPAPLLIGVVPGALAGAHDPWPGMVADVTQRLRRACARYAHVSVEPVAAWARRYAASPTDTAALEVIAGTLVARAADRGLRRHPDRLVLDPAAGTPGDVGRLVRDQAARGRDVVLTAAPGAPDLAALVAAGAARVAPGDPGDLPAVVAGLGDPSQALVLHRDPEVVAAVRTAHPAATVLLLPADQPLGGIAARLWLLDTAGPDDIPTVASADNPPTTAQRYVDLAADLPTAAAIRSAVDNGYRRVANRASALPRTPRERLLAAIWADLLRLPEVGVHDDFFDLGGDSLLAMRLVHQATAAGVSITPRQLVAHPTIAQLCVLADAGGVAATATVGAPDGATPAPAEAGPVTPAQSWFLTELAPRMRRPAHFNHPYYLEVVRPVAPATLGTAVRLLVEHHDALRLRFDSDPDATGGWRQRCAPVADAVPFTSHDLRTTGPADLDTAVERLAATEQTQLDLHAGPTVRVLHVRLPAPHRDRLLIVTHHLVVDAVSRGILLDDLQSLCGQLECGSTPVLPGRTTSYLAWSHRLAAWANRATTQAELPFWLDQHADGAAVVAPDDPSGATTLGTLGGIGDALDGEVTAGLHEAARRVGGGIRDLLVWAVAATVADSAGSDVCALATTGHGREDLFHDVDVSRTVGWFQVLYPIRLRLRMDATDVDGAADVVRQLRRVPRNGIGYGALRYGSRDLDVRRRLTEHGYPWLAVNYMGNFGFDEVPGQQPWFEVCTAPYGSTEDPDGRWPFPVDVAGSMVAGRLRVDLSYGTTAYRRSTAQRLLDGTLARLRRLAAGCLLDEQRDQYHDHHQRG
ncbi:MAG: hypothetical protein HY241_16580 [Actinobacteria bacterium]|nr:hypothetical protein [Actinomycetota bacterium]